jgi:hypothetical protein
MMVASWLFSLNQAEKKGDARAQKGEREEGGDCEGHL